MRTAVAILAVAGTVMAAPLALGGVIVTALAATLTRAHAQQTVVGCAGRLPAAGAAGAIDAWIARTVPGSPLRGLGAAMVAGVSGTGLDPRLLAAIALQETRLGTAGGGPAVDNPFGLGPGLAFPSWAAAIALAVRTLWSMHAAGAQTIAQVAVHWAPVGAANDPSGLNANWVGGVATAYAALGGNPSGSVFGHRSTTPCGATATGSAT
jgi:hypothetical protein